MMLGIETEAMIFLFAGLSGITVMLVYDILVDVYKRQLQCCSMIWASPP